MKYLFALLLLCNPVAQAADKLLLFDAHIHYSDDAWSLVSAERAIELLRAAGVNKALVSSSGDAGTQALYRVAPDLVVPVLRPYRTRGELSSWMHDESVVTLLEGLLSTNQYAGIGEFHANGEQIDLPVLQQVIALARRYNIFLHAHVDVEALHRIFTANPEARVLWAHAGFESPEVIAGMMQSYPGLWADLSFRKEYVSLGTVTAPWRALFERFPTRFMLGTDTYSPERWFYLGEYHDWARAWLAGLPPELAANLAYRNAESLLQRN